MLIQSISLPSDSESGEVDPDSLRVELAKACIQEDSANNVNKADALLR